MRLAWRLTRDAQGAVTLRRVLDTDRAMLGCPIEEAPARAARLHALCPMAHQIAVSAALGAPLPADALAALDREAAMAGILRFALHWPLAFGHKPDTRAGAAQSALRHGDDAHLADILQALAASPATRAMANIGADRLTGIADPQAPSRPLAARFEAMIYDAFLRAAALRRGCRLSQVRARFNAATLTTARGDLNVRLSIRNGAISTFHSASPTDGLFADAGPASAVVRHARDAAQARIAVLALDPCAAPDIAIANAPAHA